MSSGDAWERYWSTAEGGRTGSCLPNAQPEMDAALGAVWAELVKPLRPRARMLDLATGDGTVLVRMRALRPDLALTGVDSSRTLPQSPKGTRLKAGVAMERLPFADACFDAVSSQFGFEYGDTAAIATQVGRVLKPGGRLAFIVHDASGPVVAHNAARGAALAWAVETYIDPARALVGARRMMSIDLPAHFLDAPNEARARFPAQSVAWEFTAAIVQTLQLGRPGPPAESLAALSQLEARARNEIARINSLRAAAQDGERIGLTIAQLAGGGIAMEEPGRLRSRPAAAPFAWLIRGRRPH